MLPNFTCMNRRISPVEMFLSGRQAGHSNRQQCENKVLPSQMNGRGQLLKTPSG